MRFNKMKFEKIILGLMLGSLCITFYSLIQKPSTIDVNLKYAFIDSLGETIFSNDDTSVKGSEPSTYLKSTMTDGTLNYEFGIDFPLYQEVLESLNIDKLRIWIGKDDRTFDMDEIPISDVLIRDLEAERQSKLLAETKEFQPPKINHKKKRSKAEKAGDAKKRHEEFLQNRGGYIDYKLVQKVRQKYNEDLKKVKSERKALKDGGIAGWDWLGPGNIGGRSRAIAIKPSNPDEIFFGSVAGGLWKSNNAGGSWSPVDDFWASLSVTDIVIDQNNDDIIYVSTGEYGSFNTSPISFAGGLPGAGIFKSEDGGISWTNLPNPSNQFWIHRLATVPNQPGVLYMIAANGGISSISGGGVLMKSFNGGDTWPVSITIPSIPQSLGVSRSDPEKVFVGGIGELWTNTIDINASFTQTSTNFIDLAGSGSNQIPNAGRIELAFGSTWIYALCRVGANGDGFEDSEIWRSDDNGGNWFKREDDEDIINQGDYCMAIWVDPTNDNRLMVGGLNLWCSYDGGANFNEVSDWRDYHDGNSAHADQHMIISHPNFNGSSNKLIYVANDGGIQRADFDDTNWTNLTNGTLGVTTFTSGAISKDGTKYIGGAHDNSISIGTNSTTWFQPFTGDGGATAISQTNKNIMYGMTQLANLNKSEDGGISWTYLASFNNDDCSSSSLPTCMDDNPNFYAPMELHPTDHDILYVGARSLWRSIDGADSFNSAKNALSSNSQINTIEISKSNPNIVMVGYDNGKISRTNDITDITNWVDDIDDNAAIPNRTVMDIAIHPQNDQLIAVVMGGYNNNNVWCSDNGGANWVDVSSGLNSVHINTITWHPTIQGWLYVGSDLGVMASNNQGQDWSIDPLYDGSEGPVNTQISELFWQGDGSNNYPYYLCAATSGRSLWRTSGPVGIGLFVNKNYTGPEIGTRTKPFNTFREALDVASPGSTITFLSTNDHDEVPSTITIKKRIFISLDNGNVPVVLK